MPNAAVSLSMREVDAMQMPCTEIESLPILPV